ncbi:MAG: SMC family ATPase [Candidatus Micrarchaeaceae archaeon]
MINSIELINWKTHKHTLINFGPGVNVITGVMGAGKSSVLDAISFALFGTFPSLKEKRVSLKNIISKRPVQEIFAEVRLAFSIGDDNYLITRKIQASSTSSILEKNGSYLQTQTERVTEEIEKLLKVDYDTFSRAIYSRQNELEYFLDIDKSSRKKGIDEMLGLSSFAFAEQNATTLYNNIKHDIETLEKHISSIDLEKEIIEKNELVKQKEELTKEQEKLNKESNTKKAELSDLKKQLVLLQNKYNEKKELEKKFVELKSRLMTLKGELDKIGEIRNYAEIKEDIEKFRTERTKMEEAIKATKQEELHISKEYSKVEEQEKNIEKDLVTRDLLLSKLNNRNLDFLQEMYKKTEEKLESLKNAYSKNESIITEENGWIEKLSKSISTCPLCERPLEPEMRSRILENKKRRITQILESNTKLQLEINISKLELEKNQKAINEFNEASNRIKEYIGIEEKKKELEKKKKELSIQLSAISKKSEEQDITFKNINEKLNAVMFEGEKAHRKEQYMKELEDCSRDINKFEAKIAEISVDESAIYSLSDTVAAVSSKISELDTKIASNYEYEKRLLSDIKAKEDNISRFTTMKKEIEAKRDLMLNISRFHSALLSTEGIMRNTLVNSINSIMQSIWPEVYPYGDYLAVKLDASTNDYSLQVLSLINNKEVWESVDSIASGGERSIACLALRIAFAMVVVPNLKWLILDEPTHNIDSNGIDKLITVFGEKLPNIVEQIFVITHDEALKQIANATIYMLERDKAVYGYTEVSKL